jgi:hypothetical protein
MSKQSQFARCFCSSLVLLLCVVSTRTNAETSHTHRAVGLIAMPDASRDCLFFTLQGVNTAEPAVLPDNPWFAVPRTHPGFKEIYAAILMARATGALLNVQTTGQAAATCSGHPGANSVVMHP